MKALLTTLLISFSLVGCSSQETADDKTPTQEAPSFAADEHTFVEASQNLVDQFSRNLKSELMAALNSGGPSQALKVCQTKAPEIAASHTRGGWSIKRISDRTRNFNDRPINDEGDILAKFADTSYHQDYYQDWYGSDSTRVFRYCQKIMVQPMCLQCHGDLQTMGSDLYKQVKIMYPWDKATGYKAGDLRGMFVVEASWPEGRDLAKLLASGVDIKDLDSATDDSTMTDTTPADTTPADTTTEDTMSLGNG